MIQRLARLASPAPTKTGHRPEHRRGFSACPALRILKLDPAKTLRA